MTSEANTALLGRTVAGKYRIQAHLGGGAMGAVYRATQIALEKDVAIKVLHRELAVSNPVFVERFQREALAASRLDHPNSVRVIDYGEEPDGLFYLVMELVDGCDLHQLLLSEPHLGDARVVDIMSQALAALAVAHEQGVVHRDLKLENIMVRRTVDDEGDSAVVVKVCDFGIARLADPRTDRETGAPRPNITATGFVMGTPEYMSPEQARGDALDARADLYSMGVVLFRLLTGTMPFEAESALGVAVKQIYEEPVPPSALTPDVDPRLEAVCLKAMSKRPEDRFQTAREMRAALRAALDLGRPSIELTPLPASVRRPELAAEEARSPEPRRGTLTALAPSPSAGAPPPRRAASPAGRYALVAAAAAALLGAVAFARTGHRPAPPTVEQAPPVAGAAGARAAPDAVSSVESAPSSAPVAAPVREPSGVGSVASVAPRPIVRGAPTGAVPATAAVTTASPPPETPAPSSSVASTAPAVPSALPIAPPPAATVAPAPIETATPLPAFDPSTARVSLAGVSTTSGLPGSSVRNALNHAPFTRCYQDALRAAGARASGTGRVHLSIDDSGRVTSATASGLGFLPSLKGCVETAARSVRIRDVDTGEATADVTLAFSP